MKKLGRPTVLTDLEEQVLVDVLELAARWGCPFQLYDIRVIVCDYLNSIPRKVAAFQNNDNMPRDDWVRGLLSRYPHMSNRFAENIKREEATTRLPTLIRTVYKILTLN